MSNTNTNPELVISCIKTNPFLSLLTPNIQWVSHPSLAKPTISTSKRLLISEVPSEARWVGRCKQVSRQVSEITQPRTTWFNLAAQSKGVFKDYIHWTIINMDLIISRTIFAKEKNTNYQTCGIYFVPCNIPHLFGICKKMCLVFVLMTASLVMQKNTNWQSAQGRYLNTLGVPNIYWTDLSSKQQVLNGSQLPQDDQHQYLQTHGQPLCQPRSAW